VNPTKLGLDNVTILWYDMSTITEPQTLSVDVFCLPYIEGKGPWWQSMSTESLRLQVGKAATTGFCAFGREERNESAPKTDSR